MRNNFVDKEKEANFSANTSQNFALVCMIFLASTGIGVPKGCKRTTPPQIFRK